MQGESFIALEDYQGPDYTRNSYWFLATPVNGDYKQTLKILINLTQKGYIVFSPLIHSFPQIVKAKLPANSNYWNEMIDIFLTNSRGLILVKSQDWQESKEVKHEVDLADKLDLQIVDYDSISTVGLV